MLAIKRGLLGGDSKRMGGQGHVPSRPVHRPIWIGLPSGREAVAGLPGHGCLYVQEAIRDVEGLQSGTGWREGPSRGTLTMALSQMVRK